VDSLNGIAGIGQPSGQMSRPPASYRPTGASYRRTRFRWDGDRLMLASGHLIAMVESDAEYSTLWRVRLPDGHVSDMVNRTRAKDAAETLALVVLNREEVSAQAA
jgi:hypothetical protein